jgi:UDP-N-acetylglucosamine 2-epimerase (non-hydrolysing)
VITDSGGTQEEMAHFGVPTLILRKCTERQDGLGRNVFLSEGDLSKISWMATNWQDLQFEPLAIEVSPSAIIMQRINC